MVRWQKLDVEKIATYCERYFKEWQAYPSMRDIFYYFIDNLWPNTDSVYKGLSRWLVKMRVEGKIDWKLIRDGAGRERSVGDWLDKDPGQYVEYQLNIFAQSAEHFHLPKWLNQDKVVVVVAEKEADFPPLRSIGSNLCCVDVLYTRGYSGWRTWFELRERLQSERYEDKEIIVLAVGDFDPSGEDIVRFSRDALETLGLDLELEKIMVTKEQVDTHSLPHRPEDAREIAKLKKDPRFKSWSHGVFRVETAAFRAKAPKAFRSSLVNAIAKHFDTDVYEEVKQLETEKREEVAEQIDELIRRLQP